MKTVYETNYQKALDTMLDKVIRKWGYEHEYTIYFATLVDKYYDQANYENRETMERAFKGLMK